MNTISISELKINPSLAILQSEDYPLAIKSRSQTKAYILGKSFFESILSFIEDRADRNAVSKTDFKQKVSFEKVAKELGV